MEMGQMLSRYSEFYGVDMGGGEKEAGNEQNIQKEEVQLRITGQNTTSCQRFRKRSSVFETSESPTPVIAKK